MKRTILAWLTAISALLVNAQLGFTLTGANIDINVRAAESVTGVQAAQITAANGAGFTLNGIEYFVTNRPSITLQAGLSAEAATNISTAVASGIIDTAISNLPQPNILADRSAHTSYFQTVENGTGTVWTVTGPFTNLVTTPSVDANPSQGTVTNTWPFQVYTGSTTYWFGEQLSDLMRYGYESGSGLEYYENSLWDGTYPVSLSAVEPAIGSVVVSLGGVFYSTNLYATFTTAAGLEAVRTALSNRLDSAEAAITALEADTLQPPEIIAIVNPSTLILYGANSITNETGFGAFLSTNNTANVNIVAVDPVAGQVIASYVYRVTADHVVGAATLSHHLTTGSGAGTTSSVATVVQSFSPAGASLSSNTVATFRVDAGLSTSTNIVASFALPSVASGGVVRVSLVETIGSVRDVTAKTGGDYPMALTLNAVPIPYATTSDLAAKSSVTYSSQTNYLGTTTGTVINVGGVSYTNFFTEFPARVPQTGQTNVYAEGSDDGSLRCGVPWPTARFLRVAATGAETNQVLDALTGTIWAADASLLNTNWYGAIWYINNVMNTNSYGGASDWRLPSIREMQSLVSFQYSAPALCNSNNTAKWAAGNSPFRGVLGGGQSYMSGTTRIDVTNRAWYVEFANGATQASVDKTSVLNVYFWPCRDCRR